MSDDLNNSGGQDRTRIDVSQDHELRYWSQRSIDADGVSRAARPCHFP
jgi:hypothetical protein